MGIRVFSGEDAVLKGRLHMVAKNTSGEIKGESYGGVGYGLEELLGGTTAPQPGHSYFKLLEWAGVRVDKGVLEAAREVFLEAAGFCLDNTLLEGHGYGERLLSFAFNSPLLSDRRIREGHCVVLLEGSQGVTKKALEDCWEPPGLLEMSGHLAKLQSGEGDVALLAYREAETFEDIICFELLEALRRGYTLGRCKLCKKVFLIRDKRRHDYCDRPFQGGRSCKQQGPKRAFMERLEDDGVLALYTQVYNRRYARYIRAVAAGGDLEGVKGAFRAWSQRAQSLRQGYLDGNIPGETLVKELEGAAFCEDEK